jgi:dipeptidyl aminopeptidase/acylaminoacyl peptidase
MLLIHGGGWVFVGHQITLAMSTRVDRMLKRGWATENVDYRPGAASLTDVLDAYDRLRERVGKRTHICAYGASAGGHLALMLAHRRASLRCVIAEGAPTDLDHLTGLRDVAMWVFAQAGGMLAWSPAFLRIRQPVLLVHARCDGTVPYQQAVTFHARRHATSRLLALRDGSHTAYIHCPVNSSDVQHWYREERRFMAANATPPR